MGLSCSRDGTRQHASGILAILSQISRERHPDSDTNAAIAPEEADRVPMIQRGVTLAFIRRLCGELEALGRGNVNFGQLLHGIHTTNSREIDEFDRSRDPYSLRACCLHTGLSFVESCMTAGLTSDPETDAAYFSTPNTLVTYAPLGATTPTHMMAALHDTLVDDPSLPDPGGACFFVDVFAILH